MQPIHAILLGLVEGLTEYVPISSTGHLILASAWLGLEGEAVKSFEIIIQSGAIAAVLGLYRARVGQMLTGVRGADAAGRRLAGCLLLSFLPAAALGVALHRVIKARLFGPLPVAAALAAGGLLMVILDRRLRAGNRTVESLTARDALVIGAAQCLALWPGTSRAMVTLVAGMAIGLSPAAAAEYSFLLALPTLGAATVFDAIKTDPALWRALGPGAVVLGLVTSALVAAVAVRALVRYLTRHGLAVFGWYRLALAAGVWWVLTRA